MPIGSIIQGGLSLAGGLIGSSNAKKAMRDQTALGREALAYQREKDTQTRQDLLPWLQTGGKAIGDLYAMTQPGYNYTASPGYQFRLSEGLRGVENSAAARGILQSGGTLKGIDRYAEGLAAQDFGDSFNRMASIAAGGQQTGTTLGSLGQQSAANASSVLNNIGNARASGYAGINQAWQGTLGNLSSLIGGGGFKGFGG